MLIPPTAARAAAAPAVAFFSGEAPPAEPLSWFDEVVVDPAKVSASALGRLQAAGVRVIAALAGEGPNPEPGDLRRRGFAGFLFDGREPGTAGALADRCAAAMRQMPEASVYWRGPAGALERM